MSEAPTTGLRRVASATGAKALSKLSADEVLAGISDETRIALASSLASYDMPKPEKDQEASDDDELDEHGNPMTKPGMGDDKPAAAAPDAATARMTAVFAADAAKGREAQAAKLLGNADLTSLSADALIGLLADMPVSTVSADDSAAAAVLAAVQSNNANLGGGSEAQAAQAENHGWGNVVASVNKMLK
jgi:hypothetical protein